MSRGDKTRSHADSTALAPDWGLECSHDYDPAWDYDVVQADELSPADARVIEIAERQAVVAHEILPVLGIFRRFSLHPVAADELGEETLARYISGTYSEPVIVYDPQAISGAADEFGADLDVAVATTILHELAHAVQEAEGVEADEADAEAFASRWYRRLLV